MNPRTAQPISSTATAPACDQLRIAGHLADDAQLLHSTGAQPVALLRMRVQPAQGLPYLATVPLGTDVADHMAAEAMLPALRRGAVVSVAGRALSLRTDHGHAALRLEQPHSVVVFSNPHPITGDTPHG